MTRAEFTSVFNSVADEVFMEIGGEMVIAGPFSSGKFPKFNVAGSLPSSDLSGLIIVSGFQGSAKLRVWNSNSVTDNEWDVYFNDKKVGHYSGGEHEDDTFNVTSTGSDTVKTVKTRTKDPDPGDFYSISLTIGSTTLTTIGPTDGYSFSGGNTTISLNGKLISGTPSEVQFLKGYNKLTCSASSFPKTVIVVSSNGKVIARAQLRNTETTINFIV